MAADPAIEFHELIGEHVPRLARGGRQLDLWIDDALDWRSDVLRAGRRQHAELRDLAEDRGDRRHALARQQLVGALDYPGGGRVTASQIAAASSHLA